MQFVQMCAGGDLMEKTLMEAAQLLQKISKGAAMRTDWANGSTGRAMEENENKKEATKGCFNFPGP